jgi:integrase
MLSFYLIGMSFVDLCHLKPADIQDGRVMYKRKKTGKIYNIKLTEKATVILDYYRDHPHHSPYILPIIPERAIGDKEKEWYWAAEGFKYCNKYLRKIAVQCGITDKITTYVARHSWATIARSLGYSKDIIAEALGHEYGNKVTGIYLDYYSNEVIDEVNERVIS